MRKLLLVLLITTGSKFCFAQDAYQYYRGRIANAAVEMTLIKDTANSLFGFYHYIGRNGLLHLYGKVMNDGSWSCSEEVGTEQEVYFDESSTGKSSGTFNGNKFSVDSLAGSWRGINGKTLSFELIAAPGNEGAMLKRNNAENIHSFLNSKKDTVSVVSTRLVYFSVDCGNDTVSQKIERKMFEIMKSGEMEPSENASFPYYDSLSWHFIYGSWTEIKGDENEVPEERCACYDYTWYSTCQVVWNGSGVLCLSCTNSCFTGGAHAQWHSDYLCFDLRTGDVISPEKIFLRGSDAKVKSIILTHAYVEVGNAFNDNLSVNPLGIEFYHWELGTWAAGPVVTFTPWSELNSYIDPNGPMAWVRK